MLRIDVQLAPKTTVPAPTRRMVERIFGDAGVKVDGWPEFPGERPPGTGGAPVAQPLLIALLKPAGPSDEIESVEKLRGPLGLALAEVRKRLPGLPVGFKIIRGQSQRWFAFGPNESPESIQRALVRFEEPPLTEGGAFAWDDENRGWNPL